MHLVRRFQRPSVLWDVASLGLRPFSTEGLEWVDLFRRHMDAQEAWRPSFTSTGGLGRGAVPPTALSHLPSCAALSAAASGDERTVVARYTFPTALASPHHTDDDPGGPCAGGSAAPVVDLSTVLAVFDEISTWAFWSADRCAQNGCYFIVERARFKLGWGSCAHAHFYCVFHMFTSFMFGCLHALLPVARRTRRPGVSVHLSAVAQWNSELKPAPGPAAGSVPVSGPPRCGEELLVVTRVTQVGATLGFASIDLIRPYLLEDREGGGGGKGGGEGGGGGAAAGGGDAVGLTEGVVLASGKHIKYMRMPGLGPGKALPWDFFFGTLAPLAKALLAFSSKGTFDGASEGASKRASKGRASPETMPSTEAGAPSPSLRAWVASMEHHSPVSSAMAGADVMFDGAATRPSIAFTLNASRAFANGMGTTHGGAQAIAAEASARALLLRLGIDRRAENLAWDVADDRAVAAVARPLHLRSMAANYLAAHRSPSALIASASFLGSAPPLLASARDSANAASAGPVSKSLSSVVEVALGSVERSCTEVTLVFENPN